MTRDTLSAILDGERFETGPQGYVLPDEAEATVFVSTGGDVLPVGRVTRVLLKERYVAILTGRSERYYFAYEDVLGFKLGAVGPGKDRAGFTR